MASAFNVITPQQRSQLLDPFYKRVTTTVAKNNLDFPINVTNPKNILSIVQQEQKTHPSIHTPRREQGYLQNPSPAALLRRRAYENAYFEFKKDIKETNNSNTGPHISKDVGHRKAYLNLLGTGAGQPWCACFTSWCYYYAGWRDIIDAKENLALAETWGKNGLIGKKRLTEISAKIVEAGDTVVFGLAISGTDNDHVGIFSQWLVKPWENGGIGLFTTIEGNTLPDCGMKRSGKTFIITSSGSGNEGIYGKKHTYNMSTGMDDIISKKDVTFGRIVV